MNIKKIKLPRIKRDTSFTPLTLVVGGLIFLLVLYVLIGSYISFQIYKNKNTSNAIVSTLRFYPLPAAKVNGKLVPVSEIIRQVDYVEKFSAQSGQSVEPRETLRERAVDRKVEEILIGSELRKLKLSVSNKDVESAVSSVVEQNGGPEEVEKVLQTLYGMNLKQFRDLVHSQIQRDLLQEKGLERVTIRHVVVAEEDRAKSLLAEIQEGKKSFEDAAKEFSRDESSRDKGGLLDNMARGIMPKSFEEVVFEKMEVGTTYPEPVKTDEFGYHIIRLEDKTGSIKSNFEDWLNQAKEKAKIKVYYQ